MAVALLLRRSRGHRTFCPIPFVAVAAKRRIMARIAPIAPGTSMLQCEAACWAARYGATFMPLKSLATILMLVVAYWNAHRAGASYILAKENAKIRQFAIARSIFAGLLLALVVFINWNAR